jgi:hypothetical protein
MSEISINFIDSVVFQWYDADIKKVKPRGDITLRQFINAVVNPKEFLKEIFKQIEQASIDGDKELKAELKKRLFAVTPCVQIKGIRNYEGVKSFNNILVIEYDKIDNADVLRDYIFEKFDSCIFAFLSPSKGGCKFIFKTKPVNSILEFKELFFGLAYELDKFINLDISGANCVLPLFISWDGEAKVRENPTEWVQRGFKEGSFVPYEGDFECPEDINEEDKQEVVNKITYLFNRIEDNGHPQCVKASALLGGFVASNYISYDEAYDLLMELVENNDYLSKDTNNYKTTAKTMLTRGMQSPVLLKRHENE